MSRKDELLKIICKDGTENEVKVAELIDEVIFIEGQLQTLKKLPFISVNPKNPAQQRSTPAAKLYKELLQQYTNCLKILLKMTGDTEDDEESPLRKWVKQRMDGG